MGIIGIYLIDMIIFLAIINYMGIKNISIYLLFNIIGVLFISFVIFDILKKETIYDKNRNTTIGITLILSTIFLTIFYSKYNPYISGLINAIVCGSVFFYCFGNILFKIEEYITLFTGLIKKMVIKK